MVSTEKPSFLQAALQPAVAPPKTAESFPLLLKEAGVEASVEQIREQIDAILTSLSAVKPTDALRLLFDRVRPDLESTTQETSASGFRKGIIGSGSGSGAGGGGRGDGSAPPTRSFQGGGVSSSGGNWRRGASNGGNGFPGHGHGSSNGGGGPVRGGGNGSTPFGTTHNRSSYSHQSHHTSSNSYSTGAGGGSAGGGSSVPRPPAGKYQSRFKREGALQDKILNSIIGNKLNTFSLVTYNDVRDFIYQILDSGETEFIRDFVEKVFMKATQEDIYCALFAKLLSEISSKYPIIRTEMENYHNEFLKVFDTIEESKHEEYDVQVKQKQYRMGYGQFMSDLAGLNTLDPKCLYAMVDKILEGIEVCSFKEDSAKTVEEYIDCYVRMMKALKQKNTSFFNSIRKNLESHSVPRILPIIEEKGDPRPSLSTKARFGLMDLKDILSSA